MYIDPISPISNEFVKNSTINLSIDDIRAVASEMIKDLKEKLNESKIDSDIARRLELNSDGEENRWPQEPTSHNGILHCTIWSMRTFPHTKGKRYTTEQMDELEQILRSFPDDHSSIWSALKIPKSTYYRLKKELEEPVSRNTDPKRKHKYHSGLSLIVKTYIPKFVKPPTSPKSVKSIQK